MSIPAANQHIFHIGTNTYNKSYADVIGNDTTENKNRDSSSFNLENVISKFLDDFKSMINPLVL